METIKIKIPKGFEVDEFNKKTGELKFKEIPKCVMSRIKTIDDILEDNGISQEDYAKWSDYLSEDEIAYRLAKLLVKSLNEGHVPDWDNGKQVKYFPWFKMCSSGFRCFDCGFWRANSNVGSHLCLKSSELAKYAGKQFQDTIYKQLMIIEK